MKNCYIYLRVSTDEQAREGFSVENQRLACTNYAKLNGYEVKRIFTDDGRSARTTVRPALQEMLAQLKDEPVEALIIYKIDRFARNVADFAQLYTDFKNRDIKLLSVNEGDLTGTNSIIPNIFASIAQWESEVNGARTKDALMQKFREGWQPTPPPLGYRSVGGDGERKSCEPDPYMFPIIKEMFELYATGGYSIMEIQDWLCERNVLAKSGALLSHSVINTILRNPFYYGLIRWHGEAKIGKHQPILSKELFDTCQYVLAKHRNFLIRRRVHNFLLRGFIQCGECGQRYTAEWHKHKRFTKQKGKIAYYHCQKRGRNGCPAPYVEVGDLEKLVKKELSKIQFTQKFIDRVVLKTKELVERNRQGLAGRKQAIQNQRMAYELRREKLEDMMIDGSISRDTFKRKYDEIELQLNSLQQSMNELEGGNKIDINLIQEVLYFTRNIKKAYTQAPDFLKRHYLRFFFEEILIKNKEIFEVKYTPIFAVLNSNQHVIIRRKVLRD